MYPSLPLGGAQARINVALLARRIGTPVNARVQALVASGRNRTCEARVMSPAVTTTSPRNSVVSPTVQTRFGASVLPHIPI